MSEMRSRSVSNQKELCTKSVHVQILYIIRVIPSYIPAIAFSLYLSLPKHSLTRKQFSFLHKLIASDFKREGEAAMFPALFTGNPASSDQIASGVDLFCRSLFLHTLFRQ